MNTTLNQSYRPLTLAVGLALGITSVAAVAQEDGEEETTSLERITVTAQKRSQNLQEVPVSVTAFSGDQMAEAVIKDMYDLQTNVPGLGAFQSQSATNSSFSIRGVGTSSQNFGLESSVGLYVDGVYRARQNSMINNLVDVEAVEVLRGPQGTLFGKNTPSGAVLVRTVQPSHDGEDGFFEVTAGNFNLFNYAGAFSVSAIEDELAFRVTAFGSQRDGIVSDINLGEDKINDRDRWGARVQALYTPNNDFTMRIIADYAEIDEICCGAPVQLSNLTAQNVPGRFGTDAALPALGATVFPGGSAFFDREVAVSFLPESTMEDQGLSAEINYSINNEYSIVSVSAYRAFESYDNLDADFTDSPLFGTINDAEQSSFSQELRLDYTGDQVNAILGAYYFTQDLDLNYSLYTETLFNPFYLSQFGGALEPFLAAIDGLSAATGGLIAPSAQPAPGGSSFEHLATQEHESYALFGQFDYKLTDEWTLTAGIRFTNETKDLNTTYTEVLPGGATFVPFFDSIGDPAVPETLTPTSLLFNVGVATAVMQGIGAGTIDITTPEGQAALQALVPFQTLGWGYQPLGATTASRPDIVESLDDDQTTGTLKISYQPDNNSLYYASFGTGYKSGGTNTDRIANGFNPVFNAENSESFEVGVKKDFPEQNFRINAAAHYTTVDDFQANTFTGSGFNLQNAGDYKINGFELEATWLPMDTVEVNVAYAKVNAEYDSFLRGNCWNAYEFHNTPDGALPADPGQESTDLANLNPFCNRTGDRPGGEPEDYLIVKVKKDFQLADGVYAYVMGEYSYTGEIVLDGSNDPLTIQDAYNVMNLRFFMNFEHYDTDVVIWGRNVLDEEYINRTNFNTPLQPGKLNAYVSEPATFGITVKKRF